MPIDTVFPIALPAATLIRVLEIVADLDKGVTPFPGVREEFHDGHRYEVGLSIQGDIVWCNWYPSQAVQNRLMDRMRQMENALGSHQQVLNAELDPTLPGAQDIVERKQDASQAIRRIKSHLTQAQHQIDAWAETKRFEFKVDDLRGMVWILSGIEKDVVQRGVPVEIPIEEIEAAAAVELQPQDGPLEIPTEHDEDKPVDQDPFEGEAPTEAEAESDAQGDLQVVEVNRDAGTGEFVSDDKAEADPDGTVTEKVKKPKKKKRK